MAAGSQFPEDIQKFIIDHINSLEQLEALLLLKNSADKAWSAEDVSRVLFTQPQSAEGRLKDLTARGFVEVTAPAPGSSTTTYRYKPATPEVHALIERLGESYKERRISVINLIFSKPIDKIRTFSDAFRLRKKDDV
jgi:hypothetical protein